MALGMGQGGAVIERVCLLSAKIWMQAWASLTCKLYTCATSVQEVHTSLLFDTP